MCTVYRSWEHSRERAKQYLLLELTVQQGRTWLHGSFSLGRNMHIRSRISAYFVLNLSRILILVVLEYQYSSLVLIFSQSSEFKNKYFKTVKEIGKRKFMFFASQCSLFYFLGSFTTCTKEVITYVFFHTFWVLLLPVFVRALKTIKSNQNPSLNDSD